MILQCPSCDAKFLVPDSSIGAQGRRVKCGRCQHMWKATSPNAAPDIDALMASPSPTVAQIRPIPAGSNLPVAQKKSLIPLIGINAALLLVVLLLAILAYAPGWFGITSSGGLALQSVQLTQDENPDSEKASYIYAVEGEIINTTKEPILFPVMRISLVDAQKNKVFAQDYAQEGKEIAANATEPFRIDDLRISPTRKASHVIVELGSPMELMLRRAKLWTSR